MKGYKDFRMFSKNQAYWERNQLVAALSKVYPSWMELHPKSDKAWDKEWRHIVFIEIPVRKNDPMGYGWEHKVPMQLSWHLHDDDVVYFSHLEKKRGNSWDGHTSEDKYERLRCLFIEKTKKWWQFWL